MATTQTTSMTTPTSRLHGLEGALHVLLRVGAGLLFMQHGAQKLFGWLGGFGGTPGGTAELFSLMGLAGVLEFFGGLLVVAGLFTRPVAAVLALEMLIAYVWRHLPQDWAPIQNGGEPALLFMLVFAYLAAAGAGPASVDRALAGRRGEAAAGGTATGEGRAPGAAPAPRARPRGEFPGRREAHPPPRRTSREPEGRG